MTSGLESDFSRNGLILFRRSSCVMEERANPQMTVSWGRRLSSYKCRRDGNVFFLARSPEAPTTTIASPACGNLMGNVEWVAC